MKHFGWPFRILIPVLAFAFLTACGGGSASAPPVKTNKLVSVAVVPGSQSVAKGKHQQFTASAKFEDGSVQDVSASATWTSASASVATIGAGGMAVAVDKGTTTISAESQGMSGSATMTVGDAELVSLAVSPATVSAAKGLTQQFTAQGTYTDGSTQDVTSSATWTATSGASMSGNTATAMTAGAVTVSAAMHSISATATLTVLDKELTAIDVAPATASVPKGSTQQFTATATYTDGSGGDVTSQVSWVATSGATVDSHGLAKGTGVGATTITAQSGTVSHAAALTVMPPALVSIAVTPASISVAKGLTQQFTATGTYTDATTQDMTASVNWTSSTANAGIANTGLATANTVGGAMLTAASGSISGNASMTVAPPSLVSIAVLPSTATIAKGLTQAYTATGTYTDASTQDLTASATWSAAAGASILPTGVATGTAVSSPVITATSGSVNGTAVLTVGPAALVSIAVAPATASIARSTTQAFTATGTYTDATTANITSTVTWSATTGATIAPTGIATATAVGSSIITAASGAVTSNTAALTVVLPALSTITITPASVSLALGAHQQYSAQGVYVDSITADVTSLVTWNSANTAIAGFAASGGLANVVGTSSTAVAITATSGAVTSNTAFLSALASLPRVCDEPTIDMKLLVITNGKTEADFPAIKQILDYVGTPYDVLDMTTSGITTSMLSDGVCHGYYQGVIFANGGSMYSLTGMNLLTSYEITFKVRQLNWFTFPTADFGLNLSSTVNPGSTVTANFTSAAASIFPYANTATPLTISNATVYLSTASGTITPLLTDASGKVVSAIKDFGDGRLYLTQTFDSNPYLMHNLVVAYGLVNWVTKGVFLGEYHIFASAQVDDFFIADAEWIPGTPCTNPITHDRTASDDPSLPNFRLKAADMTKLVTWQNAKRSDPLFSTFRLTLAFNGIGTIGDNEWTGLPNGAQDDLTSKLSTYESNFWWIGHTYDHPETLNGLHKSDPFGDPDTPQVDSIDLEILTNNQRGQALHLTNFNTANLVTPGVTGLNDLNVPGYLYADGVRFVVTDTSVIGQPNNGPGASPNVGMWNTYAPGLYEVPRFPNDIFFNAANWADDQAEFSCIYNNPVQPPYDTFTAAQILDYTSSTFVTNMLLGDMNPQMFHQPNLHAYDVAGHSLVSDVYDQTFSKYKSLYKLPVLTLPLDQVGLKMQARDNYNKSGVTASIVGATNPTIQITIPPASPVSSASIAVTGLNSTGAEVYGGKNISHIQVNVGQTVTLPLQ